MLILEDFTKKKVRGTLGIYYSYLLSDGKEVCLEKCMDGYCVAVYDEDENIVGKKTCTKNGSKPGSMTMALAIANEKIKNYED